MEKTIEERIENATDEEMMEIIPSIHKWFKNEGLNNPYTLNSNKKMQNWLKLTFSQRFNGEMK